MKIYRTIIKIWEFEPLWDALKDSAIEDIPQYMLILGIINGTLWFVENGEVCIEVYNDLNKDIDINLQSTNTPVTNKENLIYLSLYFFIWNTITALIIKG